MVWASSLSILLELMETKFEIKTPRCQRSTVAFDTRCTIWYD